MSEAFINYLKVCKDSSIDINSVEFKNRKAEWLKERETAMIFDEIIAMWRKRGYNELEICWMLTAWNEVKEKQVT